MSYTYGGGIPEVVAYPEPNRETKQKFGAAVIGAVFIALMVAAVAAFISAGEWMMLAAVPLLGLAVFGLGVSVKEKQLQRKVDLTKPALLLNDDGIGNGDAQVHWNNVAAVETLVHFNRSVMPSAGKRLANQLTDTAGVLDGTFLVRVTVDDPQQLSGAMQHFPIRQGNVVTFNVGSVVQSNQWLSLADSIRQHAQARGVTISG